MTMQEMAALWPYNIADLSKGRATYAAQTVTVAKVFDNAQGVALKFREDETPDGEYKGVIWNVGGDWNEMANKSDRYAGPIPREGGHITVIVTRNPRNSGGYFTDCKITSEIRITPEGQRTFDRETQPAAPADPGDPGYDDPGWEESPEQAARSARDAPPPFFRDTTRESIEKQVYVKELGQMLGVVAHGFGKIDIEIPATEPDKLSKVMTVDLFDKAQVEWMRLEWFNGLYELKTGHPPQAQEADEEDEGA